MRPGLARREEPPPGPRVSEWLRECGPRGSRASSPRRLGPGRPGLPLARPGIPGPDPARAARADLGLVARVAGLQGVAPAPGCARGAPGCRSVSSRSGRCPRGCRGAAGLALPSPGLGLLSSAPPQVGPAAPRGAVPGPWRFYELPECRVYGDSLREVRGLWAPLPRGLARSPWAVCSFFCRPPLFWGRSFWWSLTLLQKSTGSACLLRTLELGLAAVGSREVCRMELDRPVWRASVHLGKEGQGQFGDCLWVRYLGVRGWQLKLTGVGRRRNS